MKKLILLLLLPFTFWACTVSTTRVEKLESKNFSTSQIRMVKIKTENGRIDSGTWKDDTISIVFEKWATGVGKVDAEDNIRDIRVYINENKDSQLLDIEIDSPFRIGVSYGCDVSIKLPSHIQLSLDSSNGDIDVAGSLSSVECSTSNGSITVRNTKGNAILRTSNGKIIAENHNGELDGKTSNGKITADLVLPEGGDCILKTSNGNIDLSIPSNTSAVIEASTSNGKIEVEGIDIKVKKLEKTELKGSIGDGKGLINLDTSNGNITIRERI